MERDDEVTYMAARCVKHCVFPTSKRQKRWLASALIGRPRAYPVSMATVKAVPRKESMSNAKVKGKKKKMKVEKKKR